MLNLLSLWIFESVSSVIGYDNIIMNPGSMNLKEATDVFPLSLQLPF